MTAGVLQALVMVLGPLAIGLWAHRAWKVSWGVFGFGVLAFIVSKAVQIPIQGPVTRALAGTPWLQLAVTLSFAPLCEETARWIALRYWAPKAEGWRAGTFFGLGHGGFEALALGVLVGMSLLGAAVPKSAADALAAKAVLDLPAYLRAAAVMERVAAMMFHCGASLLVLRAVRERRPRYLLAAMALHYLLNGVAILVATKVGPVEATGALLLVAGLPLGIVLYARALEGKEHARRAVDEPDTAMAISCRKLTRSFGDTVAFDGVELDVPKGELFALLGPNGAGKTTLVRALSGLIPPSSGAASVAGCVVGEDDDELRSRVGVLTEVPGLYEELSAELNLRIFGGLEGMTSPRLEQRIEELLRRFELWERRRDPVGSFSKGMRQKVSIARALLHEPPVVFMDEPTSGLDPSAARNLTALIRDLKARGHTILLTTHRLVEAEELADRVAIIKSKLLAVDTVDGLRTAMFGRQVRVHLLGPDRGLCEVVAALDGIGEVEWQGDVLVFGVDDPDLCTPLVVRTLVEAGAAVRGVEDVKASLESVYLQMVGAGEAAEDEAKPGQAAKLGEAAA